MDEFHDIARRHAAYFETVLRTANELYAQGGDDLKRGLKIFDEEWMNIQGFQNWAAQNTQGDRKAAKLCSNYPYVGEMLVYLRLPASDRIAWGEAALVAARRVKDRHAEAAHLHKLGLAYMERGETERAIEYLQQAVNVNHKIKRLEYEASDLGALGLAYAGLEQHERAIEFYDQALAIYRKIDAPWGEGIYLSNLADSYVAVGKPRLAIK